MNAAADPISPSAAVELIRVVVARLEDGDLAAAGAKLAGLARCWPVAGDEICRAFDRHCEDAVDPSWKIMIRLAGSASGAGLHRLAERALERLAEWPVGLPKVYADAVRVSLECARLDLAARFLGRLRRDFADDPATAVAAVQFEVARRAFAAVAGQLDDPGPEAGLLPDPRVDLGRALLAVGKAGEALEVLLAAAADDPADPAAPGLVGEAFQRVGQSDRAANWYRRAASPTDPNLWAERLGDFHLAEGNPHVAVRYYGLCSYQSTHDVAVRRKLARATGRIWRDRLSTEPWSRGGDAPRYFDCFMFNGEFELAQIRFSELWDHVEKFVVVEAAETFTGQPKPLMFLENAGLFDAFREKIVHVPVESFPAYCEHPWARDFYQRDALVRGLDGLAADDDFVLIADADELWRWDVVRRFAGELATLRMRLSKNFLNYQAIGTGRANRDTAAIARYRYVRESGASAVRFNLARIQRKRHGFWLDDAGWHFHAIGDERFIQYKFSSYAHREHHNKPELVELERVRARLERIRGGDYEDGWAAVSASHALPASIADQAGYRHLLLPSDATVLSAWIRRMSAAR